MSLNSCRDRTRSIIVEGFCVGDQLRQHDLFSVLFKIICDAVGIFLNFHSKEKNQSEKEMRK